MKFALWAEVVEDPLVSEEGPVAPRSLPADCEWKQTQQIKKRLKEIENEITSYVKALGQGKLSIERLEKEISELEANKWSLQDELRAIEQKINEATARDYNAEVLQKTLQDFRTAFAGLNPAEQSEALQCVLKNVIVHPRKLGLEVFELEEFLPGSQNRKGWLPGQDSNLQPFG